MLAKEVAKSQRCTRLLQLMVRYYLMDRGFVWLFAKAGGPYKGQNVRLTHQRDLLFLWKTAIIQRCFRTAVAL